jgi:hypothetical protein
MALNDDAAAIAAATLTAAVVTSQQHESGIESMTRDEVSDYVGKLYDAMLVRVKKKPAGSAGTMMISEPTV